MRKCAKLELTSEKSHEPLLTDVDFDMASNFHLDEVDSATSNYIPTPPADILTNKVHFDLKVSTEKGDTEPLSSAKS